MDNAVALVRAYCRVNGYLAATEYPVVEAVASDGFQSETDLDVLGLRFGHCCTLTPGANGPPNGAACPVETHPAQGTRQDFAWTNCWSGGRTHGGMRSEMGEHRCGMRGMGGPMGPERAGGSGMDGHR